MVYALMTTEKLLLYEKVNDHLISKVEQNIGYRAAPELKTSNFEIAILSAMASRFPQSRTRRCLFHYSQVTK